MSGGTNRPGESTEPTVGSPEALQELLLVGISKHQQGDFDGAEADYRKVLDADPENPNAHNFFGILRHHQGRVEEGLSHLVHAVEIAPRYVDAWNNLGNVYNQTGRLEEAAAAYRRALSLNGEHAGAWNNYATILRIQGDLQAAIAAHERAISAAPGVADVYYNYANTVRETNEPELAIAAYRRALDIDPRHSRANIRVAYMLHLFGQGEQAVSLIRDWLQREPENPEAIHLLAALTGEGVPERASDEYIRKTFDGFAATFDAVLLDRLGYKAPALIADAVGERFEDAATLDVLDAGCGTGLCGALLRPFAKSLIGIDLSSRMLERAEARDVYDELLEIEITEYLGSNPNRFDVIASADTVVYFGSLANLATGAAGALRPGGWFIFTVERDDETEGYRIGAHGRFTHSESYLRSTLSAAGFEPISTEPAILRKEAGEDVRGYLVAARFSVSVAAP